MEQILETKKGIKNMIPIICSLNVLDGILTFVGVKSGYCFEVNPLMRCFIDSAALVLLFKIIIPTVLFWCVFNAIDNGKLRFPEVLRFMFRITLAVYVFIALNHIYVIAQYIYFTKV